MTSCRIETEKAASFDCYAPARRKGGNKLCFCLSVCPSVAYIANNSRTQRPSVPQFGRKIPHLWCDSHTSFKVKRSKVRVTRPINDYDYDSTSEPGLQIYRRPRVIVTSCRVIYRGDKMTHMCDVWQVGNYCRWRYGQVVHAQWWQKQRQSKHITWSIYNCLACIILCRPGFSHQRFVWTPLFVTL